MSLHRPTIIGRIRSDPGLLLLTALVVALTSALLAAVAPLSQRTADDAIAATVRDAGTRGTVVATAARGYDDPTQVRRDPGSATEVAQNVTYARNLMSDDLAAAVRPGVATVSTPALHLLDAGPGRYLRLVYVDPPGDAPLDVTWTSGGPPQASVGADRADAKVPPGTQWPVQVGLSEAVAQALGLAAGDPLPAEDSKNRPVSVVVSGIYRAADPSDEPWAPFPELLQPSVGVTENTPRTAGAALVSADSLPDLRLAAPSDEIVQRVVFVPRPERMHYDDLDVLEQSVAKLQASAGSGGAFSWDSQLGLVLEDGAARVHSARGQAAVLLLGLLAAALLVLVLAAQLLVARRSGPVASARERGATVLGIAAELFVESLAVAVLGAAVGVLAVRLALGDVGWLWVLPVVVVAALAAPAQGALRAAAVTDVRRVPANRSALRTAARARRLRRLLVEGAVVAVAALSWVALHQRGVTVDGRTDLTAAGAGTWWALAGAVLVVRAAPPLARWALRAARRSRGGTAFFAASRVAATGGRALPLLVVSVAVAQLTLGAALAATERAGQREGALLSVGGDARLTTPPSDGTADLASAAADAPGVAAAAAARVADAVRISARGSAGSARLVVVDAAAYARLLDASALPDAPALARLTDDSGSSVPALLTGGDPNLREDLTLRWEDADPVPLAVVGSAPGLDPTDGAVVVVDRATLAAHGLDISPDTVWAVGPGAADALRADEGGGVLTLRSEVLAAQRRAPLPRALFELALAGAALLLLLAVLGVVLAAAVAAPARAESLGRLRALGVERGPLRRVLAGELTAPITLAAVAGLVLGATAAWTTLGQLALQLVTGQPSAPDLVVPWWLVLLALVPLLAALVVAAVEAAALRRTALAQLLRGGDRR
ncbi:ABC transporter permease [Nocardioides anomalus]|uniref:ABC transporter permease n=1 Tax=Nocardioides anomalus TaxID=2712223 RepID=A0A6G6W8Z6_9ACTN|nr:ABC transporter permease [Nocardioides anomalus]QIG41575.1 ABC transporter permease [Nocardioides anomalus]